MRLLRAPKLLFLAALVIAAPFLTATQSHPVYALAGADAHATVSASTDFVTVWASATPGAPFATGAYQGSTSPGTFVAYFYVNLKGSHAISNFYLNITSLPAAVATKAANCLPNIAFGADATICADGNIPRNTVLTLGTTTAFSGTMQPGSWKMMAVTFTTSAPITVSPSFNLLSVVPQTTSS